MIFQDLVCEPFDATDDKVNVALFDKELGGLLASDPIGSLVLQLGKDSLPPAPPKQVVTYKPHKHTTQRIT